MQKDGLASGNLGISSPPLFFVHLLLHDGFFSPYFRELSSISPESAGSNPPIIFSSVDLPHPDGPIKATNSPLSIFISMPLSTCSLFVPVPNDLVRLLTSIITTTNIQHERSNRISIAVWYAHFKLVYQSTNLWRFCYCLISQRFSFSTTQIFPSKKIFHFDIVV